MAVTDLTGTKWRLNDAPLAIDRQYSLTVIISGVSYSLIRKNPSSGLPGNVTFSQGGTVSYPCVFHGTGGTYSGWYSKTSGTSGATFTQLTAPPIIEITGGTAATNATLISWIQSNATQIIDQPVLPSFSDVEVTPHDGYITMTINGVDFNLKTAASN